MKKLVRIHTFRCMNVMEPSIMRMLGLFAIKIAPFSKYAKLQRKLSMFHPLLILCLRKKFLMRDGFKLSQNKGLMEKEFFGSI